MGLCSQLRLRLANPHEATTLSLDASALPDCTIYLWCGDDHPHDHVESLFPHTRLQRMSTLSVALLASIGLLIIRVVAISGFSPSHIYFFAIYWLAEAGAMIYGITLVEGAYVPELLSCTPTHTSRTVRFAILMCFMLYIICLVRLAFSLLRTRGLGLWRVLLSQGIIHFVVVTIVFSSTSTLILLDLNDGMNLIFEILAAASLVICSTRLYRGLVMYNASEPDGFISTQTTLACKVYTPSAHQEGRGMGLPRSFAEYSTAEEGLASNSASTLETAPCRTSGTVGACV